VRARRIELHLFPMLRLIDTNTGALERLGA
jgi:hypothetical protein